MSLNSTELKLLKLASFPRVSATTSELSRTHANRNNFSSSSVKFLTPLTCLPCCCWSSLEFQNMPKFLAVHRLQAVLTTVASKIPRTVAERCKLLLAEWCKLLRCRML